MGDNMSFIDFIIGLLGFSLGGLLGVSLGFIYVNYEPKPKPKPNKGLGEIVCRALTDSRPKPKPNKGLGEIVCRALTDSRPIPYIQWSTPFTNKLPTYIYVDKYKTEDGKISNLKEAYPTIKPVSLIWNKNYIHIKK